MNLHGVAIFVLLASAAVSFPVARVALWRYRRAVQRITGERAAPGESRRDVAPPRVVTARPSSPIVRLVDLSSARGDATRPCAAALAGPWLQSGVYALGGLAYAATTTALVFRADGAAFSRNAWIVFVAFHAWPIVLATRTVVAASARTSLVMAGGYALLLAALWQLPRLSGNEVQPLAALALSWSLLMLPPTALVLLFAGRSLRAVGPMVFAFMMLAVSGTQVALRMLMEPQVTEAVSELAVVKSAGLVVAGTALVGFALFGLVGWGALAWIRRRYVRKQMSDESVTVDSLWLLFTFYAALGYAWRGPGWAAAALLPFAAYELVAGGVMRLWRGRAPRGRPLALGLLRVFGSRTRSERLFRIVSTPWRHVGVIQLIGGTDLATSNLEPDEFLEFLAGRLRRLFVHDGADLERRMGELDLEPDRDGRYRVAEFLCFDDTWRMTVSRVVASCDAVLVDLRGFSAANRGVVYELELLVETVPLSRLVLLGDDTTDLAALEEALRGAWERVSAASPNAGAGSPAITLLRAPARLSPVQRPILAALFGAAAERAPGVAPAALGVGG